MKIDVIGGELLAVLQRLPADVVLVVLAGVISLLSTFTFYRTPHARTYTYFLQETDGYDVIGAAVISVAVIGCAHLSLAVIRVRGICRVNFTKYLFCLVLLLMFDFSVGMVLSNLKLKISDTLEKTMKIKLHESVVAQRNFGVGYKQSEDWDLLQTEMLCCGVENYRDYIQDKLLARDQTIPISCCVMKSSLTADGQLVAENPSQCLLDASHRVRHSIFLRVQGCLSPLSRWLTGYVSRITTLIFASICIQAVTLLHLSWQGYQRHNALSWR